MLGSVYVNCILFGSLIIKFKTVMRKCLLIVTTVPETLAFILREQPAFLNNYFDVSLASSFGPELGAVAATEGVPVHVVPMERGISLRRDFVSIWRMFFLFRKIRPDIVHSYTPKAGLVSMVAAFLCNVPIRIHTFTGVIWPTSVGWRRSLLKAVDRLLCACATHVVPESMGVKHDLINGEITNKNLEVMGYGNVAGVDTEYFSPEEPCLLGGGEGLREQLSIPLSDFVFVFIGRLNIDKGISELYSAFERLPQNCQLLLLGSLDTHAPISDKLLKELQQHPRIHWLGFQQDIRPALLAADVLVLPSYREGFPNVVLQAGAMELPVLATDISGSNEVIAPGFNGWLVPPKNCEMLAAEMMRIQKISRSDLRQMGIQARSRIVERFERKAHWHRMLSFYQSLSIEP